MILRNFALANKLQERIKAAAQHSSSELGSAFTLQRTKDEKVIVIVIVIVETLNINL